MTKNWLGRVEPLLAFVLLAAVVLVLSGSASAAPGEWESVGPLGTKVRTVAVHPADSDVVYAGTLTGLYKSTDGGASWNNVLALGTQAVAIDPSNPQKILAGIGSSTQTGLYTSTDGGATWSPTTNAVIAGGYVDGIAFDPTNSQIVYVCAFVAFPHAGVLRSTDGGTTWAETGFPDEGCYNIAVDPLSPQTLYAGIASWPPGLWKSTDSGASWSEPGWPSGESTWVAVDPVNPQNVYTGTAGSDGVDKSTDAATTWSQVLSTTTGVGAIAVDPLQPQIVYAGTGGRTGGGGTGVYRSPDGGASWNALNAGLTNLDVLALAIGPNGTVYAGTNDGVFKLVPDTDGDGIPDLIDEDPLSPSSAFSDDAGTFGEFVDNTTGAPITIEDLPDPDGVKITTGGSSGDVTVRLCGPSTTTVPAGSEVNVTCGSVTIEVVSVPLGGVVTVTIDGDIPATVEIPGGVTVKVTQAGGGTDAFTVEHMAGAGAVTITTANGTSELNEGDAPIGATSNVAPMIGDVDGANIPTSVDGEVSLLASFADPGAADTHTCTVDWGDGTTSLGAVDQTTCKASHTYSTAGVFTVAVSVADNEGATATTDSTAFGFVVVFDPSAGFVTGGGWFDSPAGAYSADPSLLGRAVFGFNARYKKGADLPDGSTNFQFQAGGLHFKSTSYDWLVVAGETKAKFKGVGTVNGDDGYRFMLTATDNSEGDTFRIKIWETATDAVVYDNQSASDDSYDGTALGDGSIVIHTAKK